MAKKVAKEIKPKFSVRKLVTKIIHPIPKNNKDFWAKEITLLKRLIAKYPNVDFWEKGTFKKVPSFAIYLTTEDSYIFSKYQEFLFQPETDKVEIKLGEKTGEDYNKEVKPKTIKDFLK